MFNELNAQKLGKGKHKDGGIAPRSYKDHYDNSDEEDNHRVNDFGEVMRTPEERSYEEEIEPKKDDMTYYTQEQASVSKIDIT